ncbi:Enoyl-CoA hydratase/carnithine racemase [Colwellia chukchiensis]|uniref:Enoyl-CoA hydratase/carnithine racemase n=1 Tax=Colwellia chukchiensis TaxID=641665 RepID=A0A1H7UAP0_9GAMM|nr:enoyl-CoA hydratase/isomerase family protein [Colwellia chukchiensis]SEL93745.1 Enoyl-CoA hydratase/carnithine racemase [Colwellia chukchiensis]
MSTVKLEINENIAQITINRAEKRNALTQEMWQKLADYCDELTQAKACKLLIIKAAGNKAFSAGADIEELTEIIKDEQRLVANNEIVQQAQLKLQKLSIPTIAAINGVCVGGGMGIALCCDFRLSVDSAKFAITPSKLGLLYSVEDTKRLVELVGLARAKEMLYLGKTITAQQAEQWGLINLLVSNETELSESVIKLSQQILAVSSYSIAGMKSTLAFINGADLAHETEIRALFNQAFSNNDFIEGANAFLEKRAPEFT